MGSESGRAWTCTNVTNDSLFRRLRIEDCHDYLLMDT